MAQENYYVKKVSVL